MTEAGDSPRERALLFIRERHLSGCADSRAGRKGRLNIALRHGQRCYFLRNPFSRPSPHTHKHIHSFPLGISQAGQWPTQPLPPFSFPSSFPRNGTAHTRLTSVIVLISLLLHLFDFFRRRGLDPGRAKETFGRKQTPRRPGTTAQARNNGRHGKGTKVESAYRCPVTKGQEAVGFWASNGVKVMSISIIIIIITTTIISQHWLGQYD